MNRSVAAGSIACRAAIPRDEIARLIDRCCERDLDDGRRRSRWSSLALVT
jgi:hypothetical protein